MLNRSQSLISLATINDEEVLSRQEQTQLCTTCQSFNIQSLLQTNKRKGYPLSTVQTVSTTCPFCALLLSAIKDVPKPIYFYAHVFRGKTDLHPEIYIHMTLSSPTRISLELGDRFSGIRNPSPHEICIAADAGSPASRDVGGRYIGDDPLSASHFATAKHWIEECGSLHKKCKETASGVSVVGADLPTRVIEIVPTTTPGKRRLYLRETTINGQKKKGTYITLTHRWNESTNRCITTTTNYSNRLQGKEFDNLSPLFEDVFTIAENLDVRYVWIDSLCIIQAGDDLADWRSEAPNMAQYYQSSLFTLAFTSPPLQRYDRDVKPWEEDYLVRLPYRDAEGLSAGYFYAYKRRVPAGEEYMSQVRGSVLFRRGWILQEWLLSKKILWYTPSGLIFECHEENPRLSDMSQVQDLDDDLKTAFHKSNGGENILAFWYSAMQVYSAQDLTKPQQDRILAVASLAKEVMAILSRDDTAYIAGLWLCDIHHGLLWEAADTDPDCEKVPNAPSWSWASLLTPVRWAERKKKDTKKACKVTGICLSQHQRHRYYHLPEYQHPRHTQTPILFDPTNMFTCLHIRGKITMVHVRGYLGSEKNLEKAALSTAYEPIPATSSTWRAICSLDEPEIIAGWGSLERLQQDPSTCADYGVAVFALHVSTRYLRHGLWIKSSTPVLDVLFLETVGGEEGGGITVVKRLGVGRIADARLIDEFEKAEEFDVVLV